MEEYSTIVNDSDSEHSSSTASDPDPPFIKYMLTLSKKNRQIGIFLVGDPSFEQPPEEIIAVKEILMAHSETFRFMLEESPLAEKGVVEITDIQPETFRNLLRFVYGCDIFSTLSLEEALDLVYVAEKYFVEELKPKLITHISPLVTADNVCMLLSRPECLEQKGLKDVIMEIVQVDTEIVLSHKTFLDLHKVGILFILQQDALAASEIELWRAVWRWASHNVMRQAGSTSRQLMKEPLKYLRLCTLDLKDFCKEVTPTMILTDRETILIIQSISTNEVSESLTTVCNTIENRNLKITVHCEAFFNFYDGESPGRSDATVLEITTHSLHMVLISAVFESWEHSLFGANVPQGVQLQYECTISLQRMFDYKTNISYQDTESPLQLVVTNVTDYGNEFEISFSSSGQLLKLLSCTKYLLTFKFKQQEFSALKFYPTANREIISNNNKIVTTTSAIFEGGNKKKWFAGSIIKKLIYKCE